MESLVVDPVFWRNKRVLLTGHTGFKGGWLALWLQKMQSQVFGLALAPNASHNLFSAARVGDDMHSMIVDINDSNAVSHCFELARPEIVFHLAAQPLVRYAYREPLKTYQTNVLGSLHILESIRQSDSVKAVVMVTTDKCYENREWPWPYRENDTLGGYDPYSSSKACMELLTASYRTSYFSADFAPAVATVRAGNVIGGGDWAEDRLFPDLVRAVASKQSITIRNPKAIRPWQHVLEPLSGYLRLAERLFTDGQAYAEAWNFGPDLKAGQTVDSILKQVSDYWPTLDWAIESQPQPHEAHTLQLDCSKALQRLDWHGRLSLHQAITSTLEWYQWQMDSNEMKPFSLKQIDDYIQIGGHA